MAYVTDCFSNNSLFHKAVKEAFEVFCNKIVAGCSSAELLASYCDNILKKGGSEKLSDEAIEETLDKVVKLLAYISDKDLFAEFYRKKLSRRLLFDKSANDDHERLILTKLKQQCGGQFTSKMEGMVTDLTLAKENQNHFQDYLNNNPAASPGIDLTVTVLTTGFWPSYKSSDLSLPQEMVKCVEVFKEFYQTKTKHRKLTWIYSLGTCNINGKFEPKTIELILGTYHVIYLWIKQWDSQGSAYDRSRGNRRNWILVWEDGFCNFAASTSATAAGEMNAEECPAGSSSAYDYQQYQGLQPELFFKMSHEIYNYGEGIIGKVAADHSHKWIYKEPNDQEINFLSAWHNSADSHPRTWEAQFQSGIKTIALIAVREGVIQLGAIHKVIEDLSYVVLLRKKFSYIESIPGVLLPHPSSAAYPMKIDGYALSPEAWPPHFQANIVPPPPAEYYDHFSHHNHQPPPPHTAAAAAAMMKITPSMSSLEALLSKLPSVVPTGPSMAVPGNYSDVPQPYMVAKEEYEEDDEENNKNKNEGENNKDVGESSSSMSSYSHHHHHHYGYHYDLNVREFN